MTILLWLFHAIQSSATVVLAFVAVMEFSIIREQRAHRRGFEAAQAEPLRELAAADANSLETIDAIAATIVDHADEALKAINHAHSDLCKEKFNRILEAGRSIRQTHNKRTPYLNRLRGKQPK